MSNPNNAGKKPGTHQRGTTKANKFLFAKEYLIDLNGTQAAIRAGYREKSARTKASELLKDPEVKAIIQEEMDKRAERTLITADEVLNDLKELRDICMGRKPVKMTFINKLEGTAVPMDIEQTIVDPPGANKSLELLGKHLKLFTDKVENTGKDGGAIQHEHSVTVSRIDELRQKQKAGVNE